MNATSGRGLPVPLGFYDPESRSLRTSAVTFDSDSTPSSPTLPPSGSMRSGALYARRRSALPTPAAAYSSSPGMPTPRARDWKGPGYPDDLPSTVTLLKTPTANLAINGGSQHPTKRKENGHGPTLADEVEHLLPTPTATPYGNNQSDSPGAAVRPSLNSLAPTLLPTPAASDSRDTANFRPDGTPYGQGYGPTLTDASRLLLPSPPAPPADAGSPSTTQADSVPAASTALTPNSVGPSAPRTAPTAPMDLLPTPRASDGEKGGPNQRGSKGDLALPAVAHRIGAPPEPLLPTPLASDGGLGRGSSAGFGLRNESRAINRAATGASTPLPSPAGNTPPDDEPPGQLTLEIG